MNTPTFTYTRQKLLPGFDGRECKICPRITKTENNNAFLTYSMLLLSGSDVFGDSYFVKSVDGGLTFGEPELLDRIETRDGNLRTIFSTATEYYSKYHKKWFVFGKNVSYENDDHPVVHGGIATGEAVYIFRDGESGYYVGATRPLPIEMEYISACPHSQIVEYENGDFLLTYYIVPKGEKRSQALAVRYRYENDEMKIVETGSPVICSDSARGAGEPSVAKLGENYYMTIRTNEQGFLAVSRDGLRYGEPFAWKWDDGSVLENYNTMQRWIRHKDVLYLAYTRKGAHNDHVFRHRAPVFMARFDEDRMCLMRETETILVPELGARLGNFTVTDVSENEFWLVTAEWMQPIGCEKYGSDNSLWIAKVRFE